MSKTNSLPLSDWTTTVVEITVTLPPSAVLSSSPALPRSGSSHESSWPTPLIAVLAFVVGGAVMALAVWILCRKSRHVHRPSLQPAGRPEGIETRRNDEERYSSPLHRSPNRNVSGPSMRTTLRIANAPARVVNSIHGGPTTVTATFDIPVAAPQEKATIDETDPVSPSPGLGVAPVEIPTCPLDSGTNNPSSCRPAPSESHTSPALRHQPSIGDRVEDLLVRVGARRRQGGGSIAISSSSSNSAAYTLGDPPPAYDSHAFADA
ncbi:hypothetical protein BC628DRAFT_928016 [Trametes gibbosa]|nr:hypothetical protein BC628DRAFT_928016 [Trametes gibbosa]